MKQDLLSEYRVRRQMLELLSAADAASLAKIAAAGSLQEGDEYIEVDHPARGVQRATAGELRRDKLILRRAVERGTWTQIVALLDGVRER